MGAKTTTAATVSRMPSAEKLEKERQALELRRARHTYDVIAERLGYANKGTAYKAVQAALARTNQEPADELRRLEIDMLDRLQTGSWMNAMRGDPKAVRNILAISVRRARLLGLDAPLRNELTVSLDERQAGLIVSALTAILAELKLTPEQEVIAGEVVPRHLRALDAPAVS